MRQLAWADVCPPPQKNTNLIHNDGIKLTKRQKVSKSKCNWRIVRSSLINSYKAKGIDFNESIIKYLGASFMKIVKHLDDNPYGFELGDMGLDIDHIIPLVKLKEGADPAIILHYSNLQLLPSKYNQHIKSTKEFDKEHFDNWLKQIKK